MERVCPPEIFSQAHNGLSLFLSEYHHMNKEQVEKIRQLIERFSKPEFYRKKVRRPALLCRVRQDGSILITPNIIL